MPNKSRFAQAVVPVHSSAGYYFSVSLPDLVHLNTEKLVPHFLQLTLTALSDNKVSRAVAITIPSEGESSARFFWSIYFHRGIARFLQP